MKRTSKTKQGEVRLWRGLPRFDAVLPLRIFLAKEDIASATRKDPGCCAIANSCARTLGSEQVQILKTRAYIEMLDEGGKKRVERYVLDAKTQQLISDFDKGKDIPTGMITLWPPAPSNQINRPGKNLRGENTAAMKREREKARAAGKKKKIGPKVKHVATSIVRNGTGLIHTTRAYAHGNLPATGKVKK